LMVLFLSALDFTIVSTALPNIVHKLGGTQFIWVGSAFALTETAFLPFAGGLAQIWGRRPVVIGCVSIFAAGSAICGAAQSLNMLIAGRAVQGAGAGGIFVMAEIVVADLVPLRKRGPFVGMMSAVWSLASAIGPPVGGALAEHAWRWIFFLNLPLCGIAIGLVLLFMDLKTPEGTVREKVKRIDFVGNFFVITGITCICMAITWGGVTFPWDSFRVLVPLILGFALLVVFGIWEGKFAKHPVVSWAIISNRTSFAGYIEAFFAQLLVSVVIYFLPVYFQGARLKSAVGSGVAIFGVAFTCGPFAFICGMSIAITHKYKPQNILGWILSTIGLGLLILLKPDSSTGMWVGFQLLVGIGLGLLMAAPRFAVMAPLPVSLNAQVLAFFTFCRWFAAAWGLTIGSAILQNELEKKLPADFLAGFPGKGVELTYNVIPTIGGLAEPLRGQVQTAFADSLRVIWIAMVAFSGAGLVASLFLKEIEMHKVTDKDWGLDKEKKADTEKATTNAEDAN